MKKYLLFILLPICLAACKQNNWMDWKVQNQLWMEQNAKAPGVQTTPTGLQYKVVHKGESPYSPKPDTYKQVRISYTAQFINGYQFDKATNYSDYVSNFVAGFQEGLKKMNEFDEYIFYIPYNLGYGTSEQGVEGGSAYIPPYSTLIFDVKLSAVY